MNNQLNHYPASNSQFPAAQQYMSAASVALPSQQQQHQQQQSFLAPQQYHHHHTTMNQGNASLQFQPQFNMNGNSAAPIGGMAPPRQQTSMIVAATTTSNNSAPGLASFLSKLSKKYNQEIPAEVIQTLEENLFTERNVLFLDKETLVELKIPIGVRITLLKMVEAENNNVSLPVTTIPIALPTNQLLNQQTYHHHHHQHATLQQQQQQQQQQKQLSPHQNGNNNNNNNHNNLQVPIRRLTLDDHKEQMLHRIATTQYRQLQQLFSHPPKFARWVKPPQDPTLRAKLVAVWGGFDPWHETLCTKCQEFAPKVSSDWLPLAWKHSAENCFRWRSRTVVEPDAAKAVAGGTGNELSEDRRGSFNSNSAPQHHHHQQQQQQQQQQAKLVAENEPLPEEHGEWRLIDNNAFGNNDLVEDFSDSSRSRSRDDESDIEHGHNNNGDNLGHDQENRQSQGRRGRRGRSRNQQQQQQQQQQQRQSGRRRQRN